MALSGFLPMVPGCRVYGAIFQSGKTLTKEQEGKFKKMKDLFLLSNVSSLQRIAKKYSNIGALYTV